MINELEEKKVYYPETIDEEPLPETMVWESIANRPRTLEELDPAAKAALDAMDAEFLTLGDLAYLDSITTTQITDNAITTPKLAAGSVVASKLSVGSLSAITADLGTITSGTITGALIRTSSTGSRVEIDGSSDDIRIYDSGNDLRMKLDSDDLSFYNTSGVRLGYISTPTTTNFEITTLTGNAMILDAQGTNILDAIFLRTNSAERLTITETSIIAYEDILAGGASLNIGSAAQPFEDFYIDDIRMTAQTANPTSDGMMRYYDSGGSEGLRMQFGGSDFQFDASAV